MARFSIIFAFALLVCPVSSYSQEMQELNRMVDKESIHYARYMEEGASLRGIMVGFHPYNPGKWDGALWAKTLQPLAENNSYLLLCPDGGKDSLIDSGQFGQINQLVQLYQDSFSLQAMPVILVAFSLGANTGFEYYSGTSPITGALLVSTTKMPSFGKMPYDKKIFALVHGTEEAGAQYMAALNDSLKQRGAWVWNTSVEGSGHTFAIPDYYLEYDKRIRWIDSLGRVLANPDAVGQLQTSSGLQNKVEGQLREGHVIHLEYLAANPLYMQWTILDLSGKAIKSGEAFFGKGTNKLDIPTSGLAWGVYRLELHTDDGRIEKHKFIIRG